MKTHSFAGLALLLALFFSPMARAQESGVHLNANMVGLNVPALSTNSINVAQPISEFEYVGVTVTLNASAANTSTATFRFVQSYDGGQTYETTPSFTFVTGALNGTTPVTFNTTMFCPASTHIKLLDVWNTNAVTYFTNMTCKFNLKSPKRGANTNVAP